MSDHLDNLDSLKSAGKDGEAQEIVVAFYSLLLDEVVLRLQPIYVCEFYEKHNELYKNEPDKQVKLIKPCNKISVRERNTAAERLLEIYDEFDFDVELIESSQPTFKPFGQDI